MLQRQRQSWIRVEWRKKYYIQKSYFRKLVVMDRNNWVFSFFQCAGCLLLNEESSVGIHIQFVVCSMYNGCVGRQQDLHAWVCMSPACSVSTPLERDAFTSLKICHRFRMLVKFECLKFGQTFCYLWGIVWEAANALAKLHALCSVLNAFCLEEKWQIWVFFCAVPDIFAQCQGLIRASTTTSHALFHICMYTIKILAQ